MECYSRPMRDAPTFLPFIAFICVPSTTGKQIQLSLSRISTFGDVIFQAEPIGDDLLCYRTVGRLFLSSQEDALRPIHELLKPECARRLMAVYGKHLYLPAEKNTVEIYHVHQNRLELVPVTLPGVRVRVVDQELYVQDDLGLRCYSLHVPGAPPPC